MLSNSDKKILREYVREIICEDDYGGIMSAGMGSPYGIEFVSRDQLFDIFVSPFVNAFKHAEGKTKELSQKGLTLLRVTFEAIATSIIPVLQDDYAKIFAEEKETIDSIRSEYGKYYQATWDAFKNDDVAIAAFMYRPDLILTTKLIDAAPKVAAKLLSVLSGGELDKYMAKLLKNESVSRVIREQEEFDTEKLKKVINNKKVKAILANSSVTRKLSDEGEKFVKQTIQEVYERAQKVLGAKSIEELEKFLKKKLPKTEELKKAPQQERTKLERELLATIKKSMKEFYVKSIRAQAKKAVDVGVPSDHPFVVLYENVAQKINSL